jgi:hypothetical protein
MNVSELIHGATYFVVSVDEDGKAWEGKARFVRVWPEDDNTFPKGTLEFMCRDGIQGYFDIENIKHLVHNLPLNDQLKEICSMAYERGLYEAVAWIQEKQGNNNE